MAEVQYPAHGGRALNVNKKKGSAMAASNNPLWRYGFFIVLVLGLVGVFTWVTQNLPTWKAGARGGNASSNTSREILLYSRPQGQMGPLRAVWTVDGSSPNTDYIEETEQNRDGHYYFPFRNLLQESVELDMENEGVCDCTNVAVGVLPADEWRKIEAAWVEKPWVEPYFTQEPTWTKFNKTEQGGVKIPAEAHGLLRVMWQARKTPGSMLKLNLRVWSQPEGRLGERQITPILVPVRVMPPIMFEPTQQSVGVLGSGQSAPAEFSVWSPTRDKLDISFQPGETDPLLQIEARELSAADRDAVHNAVKAKSKNQFVSRVRCAYHVTVTLHEQKGGRQMDQGPFSRSIPIQLDQLPIDTATPTVTGVVRGIVEVGGEADQGKVQFKTFSAANPKTVVVPLFADPQVQLALDHYEPACLQVELKRDAKDSTALRARWDLKVTIAAGAWKGALPESSRVVLRMAGDPPRLVRIPVAGTGTR
jgi:hypothetical protein